MSNSDLMPKIPGLTSNADMLVSSYGTTLARSPMRSYAIELDPNQPDAYLLRSEVRRNLGDVQGAIADEQKAEALYMQQE